MKIVKIQESNNKGFLLAGITVVLSVLVSCGQSYSSRESTSSSFESSEISTGDEASRGLQLADDLRIRLARTFAFDKVSGIGWETVGATVFDSMATKASYFNRHGSLNLNYAALFLAEKANWLAIKNDIQTTTFKSTNGCPTTKTNSLSDAQSIANAFFNASFELKAAVNNANSCIASLAWTCGLSTGVEFKRYSLSTSGAVVPLSSVRLRSDSLSCRNSAQDCVAKLAYKSNPLYGRTPAAVSVDSKLAAISTPVQRIGTASITFVKSPKGICLP